MRGQRLAMILADPPEGGGPLPLLPNGDVLALVVRRVGRRKGRPVLALYPINEDDGAYTEELAAAWEVLQRVAGEVLHGKRMLGGQRR